MTETRRCPQCDAEIPANSPAGLCPRCLLAAANDSQSAAVECEPGPTKLTPPASGFVPPTIEELAPRFPQLEILELLGKGGMGAVYKARQPGLDRLVAVKILPPEISHDPAFAERFQREARALARLSHPHIVAVYDFGQTDSARRGSPDPAVTPTEGLPVWGKPQETFGRGSGSVGDRPQRAPELQSGALCYIVMEFVDGANLRQTIQTGKLAAAEALAIVPQICEALQFAHDEGIVHRDIKPENILIDKRGRVKIADFGLAKLLGQDASDHSLTATHQVMGTLRYMAPEQMQGSREVDHRADIYSLGVVFYELLTGELPMGKFAPPSKRVQVDVRLDEVVLRALEQDPEQRYQHASEVKTDVETISRESQSPNLAAQKPAHRGGRTALAEPVSIPLEIAESVHWGLFGEVHGKLRLGKDELIVEFEVRSLFSAFRSGLKEVSIPFDDIESVNWDGWDLTLHTKTMKALAEIPKSSKGQVAFDLSMIDVDVPGGISGPVEHFLACLPSRLVGKSASEVRPESAKRVSTQPAEPTWETWWFEHSAASRKMMKGMLLLVAFVCLGILVSIDGRFNQDSDGTTSVRMGFGDSWFWYTTAEGSRIDFLSWSFGLGALGVFLLIAWFRVRSSERRHAENSERPESAFAVVSQPRSEPRLSRCALTGAIWAGLGLMALILAAFLVTPVADVASVGSTVTTSLDPPAEISDASGRGPSGGPTAPSELLMLGFVMLILAVALAASSVFGTTTCGAVAIGHIQRSGGRLYGLPLAVADALFFPLLILNGAIFGLLLYFNHWGVEMKFPLSLSLALFETVFIGGGVSSAIVKRVWGVVSSAGVKSGEPEGVSPPTGEQVRGLTPMTHQPLGASPRLQEPDASAYRLMGPRPKLVPLLATVNLFGAILLMLLCAMEQPMAFVQPVLPVWQVWEKVDAVLGFTMSAGMFAASIGLFLWKPWARKLTLGVCVFGLASFVFDVPYLARFGLPDAYAEMQREMAAEGLEPDDADVMAILIIVVLVGGVVVVGVAWLIGQLVYFTRPRVVAAFESQGEKHGKFIEWLFTGAGAVVGVLSVFAPLALLLGLAALFKAGNEVKTVDPTAGRADSKTGEVWFGNKGDEHVMFFGPNSPTVSDRLASHLGLDSAQREAMNQALQKFFREFQAIEEQNTQRETDAQGRQITTIAAFQQQVPPLAERFWSELDSVLDGRQMTLGRNTVGLGMGMFESVFNYRIEIWRVGQVDPWYHWKESYPGRANFTPSSEIDPSSGPVLPEKLRRFWKESEPNDATDASIHRAAELGNAARVKQLLDGGASVNAKDSDGQTPLMKAVANGHRSLAITLVILGADLTEQDSHGLSVLMIAAERRDVAFLSRLNQLYSLSYERDAAERKKSLLAFPGIESVLIECRDIDRQGLGLYEAELLKDEKGENALMKAARAGDWECLKLLSHQVDSLLARDKLGRTVLMHAVLSGKAHESEWLSNDGWLTKSPYLGVSGQDNIYVGLLLIFELERSLSVLDNENKSVVQHAESHGHAAVARTLRRQLEAIITNQTAEIAKGGDDVAKHHRLRGLAWQALGDQQQAEAEFKKAIKE